MRISSKNGEVFKGKCQLFFFNMMMTETKKCPFSPHMLYKNKICLFLYMIGVLIVFLMKRTLIISVSNGLKSMTLEALN
ncbi:hypothetical protein Mgra_00006164 [Meloidogyne graminicola]|uniref:Uncharacterized protein n=1 Tax=Meloidogyne graminicola TaxID=189291 RepID=A0A8S9ZM14_9BILA|nr:hypothetical protein Mgra_00006164 [Meloidogyne graminicola]